MAKRPTDPLTVLRAYWPRASQSDKMATEMADFDRLPPRGCVARSASARW